MMRRLFGLAAAAVLLPAVPAVALDTSKMEDFPFAVLQGLDKVTAKTTEFVVPVDGTVELGTVTITVRACRKMPPEETPESAAFLEIRNTRAQADEADLFTGWMFASSPGLSAMEHPIYDVWVLDCRAE